MLELKFRSRKASLKGLKHLAKAFAGRKLGELRSVRMSMQMRRWDEQRKNHRSCSSLASGEGRAKEYGKGCR